MKRAQMPKVCQTLKLIAEHQGNVAYPTLFFGSPGVLIEILLITQVVPKKLDSLQNFLF